MILGVLGGSGLYEIDGLSDARAHDLSTPFGAPSGPVLSGRLGDATLLFMARHGRGHVFSPSEINYRANVFALKSLGAERVLSLSAVGSLREGIAPGELVLIDQFIDRTWGRATTFFGGGAVGHVSFAEPTCPAFGAVVAGAAAAVGFVEAPRSARLARGAGDRDSQIAGERGGDGGEGGSVAAPAGARAPIDDGAGRSLHLGGTYVCMEGPQFSTRAESQLHRSWGADVIGMTVATEAKLCREAELCFSALAMVTDYDAWHAEEEAVTVAAVIATLRANVAGAKRIIGQLPAELARGAAPCGCAQAAAQAVMTSPDAIGAEARQRLRALYGRDI